MFNMVAFYARLLIRSLMGEGLKYYKESFFSTEIHGLDPVSYWRVVVELVTPDGMPKESVETVTTLPKYVTKD